MKAVLGMRPWGIVLGAASFGIWWLLSREMAAGKWLLAALLIGHGVVHVMFFVPTPAATEGGPEWPFELTNAWPVTAAGLDVNLVRAAAVALIALLIGAFALAGLSTVGLAVSASWWPALVAVGSVASIATLVLFFNPQLVLGLGIDGVLLWVVVAGAWAP
jgi:hypothetical protein